ncbi:hypothetical protein EJ06DRAFT_166760 [Trichodelitschia bisporula]|uniref:Uncharacterized protein n=1 Tax=Trichodelitschia bisporula TaxID=703511 RepID=A0A6G1HMS9_9PEZI|nr:hypothetical protein EJ06DRAFT_166760 [Trichodelitschia bisporula]
MKTFTFAFAAFIAGSLAAPLGATIPDNAQFYTLQTKSDTQNLNGLYLSAKDGRVALFPGDRSDTARAGKFFTTQYDAAKTLSLHAGDDTHQVALRGANGLLDIVDVVSPTADQIPQGQIMEWSTFTIAQDGTLGVSDGADIPSRQWVAYENRDGSFGVALYDGFTPVTDRKVSKISIIATKTQK